MSVKQPTSLLTLKQLIFDLEETSVNPNIKDWLNWAHDHIHNRNMYHKRRQLVVNMSMKLLKEHLSQDEIDNIEKQAEEAVQEVESRQSREMHNEMHTDTNIVDLDERCDYQTEEDHVVQREEEE